MNILLVYPKMPDTFYAMKHFIHVTGKRGTYPPLGLLTVASLLPDDWSKKLVDLNVADLCNDDLKWANFVFLSAMNVQEESVREIINTCKNAGVKIVAGGTLFTHEHERFPEIDHFVLNEAEKNLPVFLNDFKQGSLQPIYETSEFADVTLSPLPAFDLVNMDHYIFSIVQFSRGCPFMCDFCDVTTLFGRRSRTKSSVQIIKELEEIRLHSKVQLVLFADDNLIGNTKILKEDLLPALIEWRKSKKPGFFFATQLTINLADDEVLMDLLIDAGFRHVFVGIESPDEDSLRGALKKQNLKRDQLDSILKLHRKGFIISGGFIVGFDTDTEKIFHQQRDFIQQSGIPLPIVNILKAPIGTQLFERMKQEGRISKQFAFSEGDTNITPVMDAQVLKNGFLDLSASIYLPGKTYERLIRFFKTYRHPKTNIKVPTRYGSKDILMVLRIMYLLGIKYRHRKYFWKLLFWSLKNDRKFIDKAVFYGIMIYQMHKTYLHITQTLIDQMPRSNKS